MNKKERAAFVFATLQRLFPHPEIPLKHKDNYTLLIAVILSAQSTDAQVNKITPTLFALADTPYKMAKLSVEEVQAIIRPCGLSGQKAKALVNLSKILIKEYKGRVPDTFSELEALPGVGHKTSSVIMAQAFGKAAFPVDTHIHRCAKRWGLSNGKNVLETERDLKKLFPEESWIDVHLQIIYFARKYCPAKGHKIENCPICSCLK